MTSISSYLSITEAAERMHVLPQTVEHWIGVGVLLAQEKSNAKAQVLAESVTQWLSEKNHLPIMRPVAPDVLKVAVVEDDPDIVKLLEMSIEGFDFKTEVHSVGNGFQGLVLMSEFHPDVLIADLNMPQMDGFRMLAALASCEFAPKKIIVITALSDADIVARGGVPERAVVLRKPIALNDLEEHVRPT
jgi:CheY-like chemotaxis protein